MINQNNLHENEDEIKIDEKQLCDDEHDGPITFTTSKNDIKPLTKSIIIEQAANISKAAVQKLVERKILEKDTQKIRVDNNRLSRGIKKEIKKTN